jgi:hypothetical protein
MKNLRSVAWVLFSTLASCGRPASDIVHPKLRPEVPLTDSNTNTEPQNEPCAADKIPVKRSNGTAVCVKRPEIREVSSATRTQYWEGDVSARCSFVESFVKGFAKEHFSEVEAELSKCSQIVSSSNALFVSVALAHAGRTSAVAFEIADSRFQDAVLRVCTSQRTSFVAGMHCTERFIEGKIPSAIANLAPEPSDNIVDFFPSLEDVLNK